MSSRTQDLFDMEKYGVLGGGGRRGDRPEEEGREASSAESFSSSPISADVARSPPRPIRKLLEFIARWRIRSHAAIPDKPEDARGTNILLPQARPQIVATIESDRQSSSSEESSRCNKYGLMMTVEGLDEIVKDVRTLFDTGSPNNFIYRATLDKLGKVKEYPLPLKQVKAYIGALHGDDDECIAPKSYVRLLIWNDQIKLSVVVDLKILELQGEPGGFQIILGEKFIGENGDEKLLGSVRQANTVAPSSTASGDDFIAHLRRIKTSKTKSMYLNVLKQINSRADILGAEQEAISQARDLEQREEDRRLYTDTHGWETSLNVSIPPTMQLQSISTLYQSPIQFSAYGEHIQPQVASPFARSVVQQQLQGSAAQLPNASAKNQTNPYYKSATVQQTVEHSLNQMLNHPADWQSQKTDTWQSHSTTASSAQYIQSSRQSTASSMSTAPSVESARLPAKGGRFASGRWRIPGGVRRESRK